MGTDKDHEGWSRRRVLKTAGVSSAIGAGMFNGCLGNEIDTLDAKLTVTHWPLLMYSLPYQAAMEKGYFEEERIEFESVTGSEGGETTVENILTGIPFGEVATPAAVNAHYSGEPITVVASATNTPGTVRWVSSPDSEIESIEDLAGRTVGYTTKGSVTQSALSLSFDEADSVNPEDAEFRAMGGLEEGLKAVRSDEIDAAANVEPVFSKQQSEDGWNVVFEASDYIEDFQQTVLAARHEVTRDIPNGVRAFIRARSRGVEFVRERPSEAAEIFASYNEGFGAEEIEEAIENVNPDEYYTTGGFDTDGLATVERGMKETGLTERDIEWSGIIGQSFLPEEKHVDFSDSLVV